MSNSKTTQSLLNTTYYKSRNFIKFCYILVFFVVVSCGNETKSKAVLNNDENVITDTEVAEESSSKTILFFGDSITAGYGLDDTNDAFPGIIQTKIDSLGLGYTVINSGVSGETTAGGRSRIDWILNQSIDIFVLELGANDGLRGVPITETKANLQTIIDAVKTKDENIKIILAGMEIPPNMGQDYTTEFRTIFSDLASKNELVFIPFILENVGGVKELNQRDGIHPTAEGHRIVAENVWEVLLPVIEEMRY
ncbi:MAG TPA: arylesterase [Aequorivita sp.]|nr:arylesterase [Aequorivita sp.]